MSSPIQGSNGMGEGSCRREFMRASAAAVAGGVMASWTSVSRGQDDSELNFKISIAEWSLHRMLFDGELDNLDFAAFAKTQFGIDAVEYVNRFFKDNARDAKYLAQLHRNAADQGVRSLLIMVDGEGRLGDPERSKRQQAVENHYQWVEAAKQLGCHSIRVNAASEGSYDEQSKLAADGLRQLCEFASDFDLNAIVENHGGLSSNGAWLAAVIQRVDLPNCGTLPDFGNFRVAADKWYDRYKGVAELMPFAMAVSAKSHNFDADGNETQTDFFRMMRIVLDAGYRGYIGIEYEGNQLDEVQGVLATKRLLDRVRKSFGGK